MKTLQTLFLLALLLTLAAWTSLRGVSGEGKPSPDAYVTEPRLPVVRAAAPAPLRANPAAQPRPRPPRPAKPLEPKPASATQLAFQHALEGGDVCAVYKILSGSISSRETYGALLAATEPSADVLEVFGPNGPMLADEPSGAKPKGLAARTLWALKLGGDLAYTATPAKGASAEAARDALLELEKQDPGNGLYPYFRLAVEEKLGYTSEQLKATAEAIAASPRMDSAYTEVEREIRAAQWRNPAFHFAINWFHSSGIVAFHRPNHVVKRLLAEGTLPSAQKIADLLTEEGRRASRPSHDGGYDHSRFNAGRNLEPGAQKTADQLNRDLGWKDSYAPGLGEEHACNPAPYEAWFYEARESR